MDHLLQCVVIFSFTLVVFVESQGFGSIIATLKSKFPSESDFGRDVGEFLRDGAIYNGLGDGDLIKNLPGAPPHAFRQYSGYVTVDESHGRRLFYWYVEAENDHGLKPLTLWLNGGPGCSSVAGGALSELGPFFPSKSGKSLIYNNNSWIKESNLVFLESPAGVGFSYSDNTSDYTTGDQQTAIDTREFLLGFFQKFPSLKNRTFYISGESYAGHYVVDLAHLLWSKRAEDSGVINFQGFLLGNPWTVTSSDFKGGIDFLWTRSLISTATYRKFLTECNPLRWFDPSLSEKCGEVLRELDTEIGDVNPYDVYVDVCTASPLGQARDFLKKKLQSLSLFTSNSASPNTTISSKYDPCIDDEVEVYLNQPSVVEAIHAKVLPYKWQGCSDIVNYSFKDFVESKLSIWEKLLETPLRFTVFSGDVDSVCPTMGTRDWISKLEDENHLVLSQAWRPWYHNKQVGGYVEEYNKGKFKFVTVRNAGHMVPYMQPERALELFRAFIGDMPLP